jgi:hypothetical protein
MWMDSILKMRMTTLWQYVDEDENAADESDDDWDIKSVNV